MMRKDFFSIVILFYFSFYILSFFSCSKQHILIFTNASPIELRLEPNIGSSIKSIIPTGTRLTVSMNKMENITTGSIKGHWTHILTPQEGWAFAADLFQGNIPLGMTLVPGGTFQMGDQFDEGLTDELPVHELTVNSFLMSNAEVTFSQYDLYCNKTKQSNISDPESWGRYNRPVINIDWYSSLEYCNWLSRKEGYEPVYKINKKKQDPYNINRYDKKKWVVEANWYANGYRLPTEAEWEYAARECGKAVHYANGKNTLIDKEANFNPFDFETNTLKGNYPQKTMPVMSYPPNSLGLYDMAGNVWEWCWDIYIEDFYAKPEAKINNCHGPKNIPYSDHVFRGGSWFNSSYASRAANRDYCFNALSNENMIGFRIVRSILRE